MVDFYYSCWILLHLNLFEIGHPKIQWLIITFPNKGVIWICLVQETQTHLSFLQNTYSKSLQSGKTNNLIYPQYYIV